MGKVRIIEYEVSDEEVLRFLKSELRAGGNRTMEPSTESNNNGNSSNSSTWQEVANKFCKYVSETAAWGRTGQRSAMLAWLKHGGSIELTALWKAAGVKTQHDYSGIGGSLTKNMIKSGGPREWYSYRKNSKGEWIYQIIDVLAEPLKIAFGV